MGKVGGVDVEIMLDSGSSVSLVQQHVLSQAQGVTYVEAEQKLRLLTASGEQLPIIGHVSVSVHIGELKVTHNFVVVDKLVAPVIIGVDFLHKNSLMLDFTKESVKVCSTTRVESAVRSVLPMHEAAHKIKASACIITAMEQPDVDVVEECAVPMYDKPASIELPECSNVEFHNVVHKYEHLFRTTPGVTDIAFHYIPTIGHPVKVPPRRVPTHYRKEVEQLIHSMLEQDIITESSSPWMAPAVFVPKKSGDIRLCIDYRELNKKTTKDAYPLPLPDEVQDRLSGSKIFSTLDLQSGYWQLPVNPEDQAKTAFCPGPGMGLFQFKRMPFGLTGAPSSFQRLMDRVLRGLPFVTTYLDNILIHSPDEITHCEHLHTD